MKNYLVTFYYKGHRVCNCIKTAENAENAELDASFALICRYSNIKFDNVITELINE